MVELRQIHLFVGQDVSNPAERAFLRDLVSDLEKISESAVILANFECGGRQIDCVVATGTAVALFEIKSSVAPIRGQINGTWERRTPAGQWLPYTNAYQQALEAKNKLRTEMSRFLSTGSFYPSALVTFPFGIPSGSELPDGDFKVSIDKTAQPFRWLSEQTGSPWSLDNWISFASRLSLDERSAKDALDDHLQVRSSRILGAYHSAFLNEHLPAAERWIAESEDQETAASMAVEDPQGCVIYGPSGCGKTLLAKKLACQLVKEGSPCIYIAAKEYNGRLRDTIERELSLLADTPPANILRAMTDAATPAYIIVDGLNWSAP